MDVDQKDVIGSDMECQKNGRGELTVENVFVTFKPFNSAIASCLLKTMFCVTQVNSL